MQAAATTAITSAGLVLGGVTMASSATVPAGNVISESPVATTRVVPDSAVNLTVSTGPPRVALMVFRGEPYIDLSHSSHIVAIEMTSRSPNKTFRARHCVSVLSKRASSNPAAHQSESERIAATPNAQPSSTAS
jgi:PASTA domain